MWIFLFLFYGLSGTWVARARTDLSCLSSNSCASNPPEVEVVILFSSHRSSKDSGLVKIAQFKSDEGRLVSFMKPLEITWEKTEFSFRHEAVEVLRVPLGYKLRHSPRASGCEAPASQPQNSSSASPLCCDCQTLPPNFCGGSAAVDFDFDVLPLTYRVLRIKASKPSADLKIVAGAGSFSIPMSKPIKVLSSHFELSVDIDWPSFPLLPVGTLIAFPVGEKEMLGLQGFTTLSPAWLKLPEEALSDCGGLGWPSLDKLPLDFCERGSDPCSAGQIDDFLEADRREVEAGRPAKFAMKDRIFKSGWAYETEFDSSWAIYPEVDVLFDFSVLVKIKMSSLNFTVSLAAVWAEREAVELIETDQKDFELRVPLLNKQFYPGSVSVGQSCGELKISPAAVEVLLPPDEKKFATFAVARGEVVDEKVACDFELKNDLGEVILRFSWSPKGQTPEL